MGFRTSVGFTRVLYDQQEMWFSVERGNVTLLCNLGRGERQFPLTEGGDNFAAKFLGARGLDWGAALLDQFHDKHLEAAE